MANKRRHRIRTEPQSAPIEPRSVGFDTALVEAFLAAFGARYGPIELMVLSSDDPRGGPPWHAVIAARAFDELSQEAAVQATTEVLASCAADRLVSSLGILHTAAPILRGVCDLLPGGALDLQFSSTGEAKVPRAVILRLRTSKVGPR